MKKDKAIKPGEIRVIKIGEEAIKELIVEFVMDHREKLFDSPEDDYETIFHTCFSPSDNTITIIANCIADNSKIDFRRIASEEKCTTDSVYKKSPYVTRKL